MKDWKIYRVRWKERQRDKERDKEGDIEKEGQLTRSDRDEFMRE